MAVEPNCVKLYDIENRGKFIVKLDELCPEFLHECDADESDKNFKFSMIKTTPEYSIGYTSGGGYYVYGLYHKFYTGGETKRVGYSVKKYLCFGTSNGNLDTDLVAMERLISELDFPKHILEIMLEEKIISFKGWYGYAINTEYVKQYVKSHCE